MAESSGSVSASVIGGTHPSVLQLVEDAVRRSQQGGQGDADSKVDEPSTPDERQPASQAMPLD